MTRINRLVSLFLVVFLVSSLFPFGFQNVEAQVTYLFDLSKWDSVFRVHNFTVANLKNTIENKSDGFQWNITCSGTVMKAWMTQNSNRSFTISTSKLAFYYQPPLDLELNVSDYDFVNATHAIENGNVSVYRPENVVGSYAVYSTTKWGNEYMTGKIFHLYRPLLVDAVGKTSWGWLNFSANTLTIGWNKTWVASAVFPLVIDPTFGLTSIGASHLGDNTYIHCSKYTLSEAGLVSNIGFYCDDINGDVNTAIYDDDGTSNAPSTLMGQGAEQSPSSYTGWLNFAVEIELTAGNWYLSAWYTDVFARFDTGATAQHQLGYGYITGTNTFPNPLGTIYASQARAMSIFANYTAAASGTWLNVSCSQSLYPSASNTMLKALGFQSTGSIYPSATGLFWKATGFTATNTFIPSSSNIFNKAIGTVATQTLYAFTDVSRGIELAFQSTSTFTPFTSAEFGRELSFLNTGNINLYSDNSMNKAVLSTVTAIITFLSSQTLGKEQSFTSTELLKLHESSDMTKEVSLTLFEAFQTLNIFAYPDVTLPALPATPSQQGHGGNARPTIVLNPYQKAGVGIILIGIVAVLAIEAHGKIRKKRKMRKPGHDSNGKPKHDPNLTPPSYPGRKPRWKHPRPKEEDYAR